MIKKLLLSSIFMLLFIAMVFIIQANAQQFVLYMPVIFKDGDDMAGYAILEISDGETTVNLLSPETGFFLKDWEPKIISPKGGGVYQDSTLAPHRVLVSAIDANATEVFDLTINGQDQDGLIRESQDLLRLLVKARNYSLADWQSDIVWLKKQANCETNPEYAFIVNFDIPELDNPYAEPFVNAAKLATMDGITLEIERQHWLALEPGTGECAQANSVQTWYDEAEWEVLRASGGVFFDAGLFVNPDSGYLFIGGNSLVNPVIWRSTDNGDNWALNYTHAGGAQYIKTFEQLANGDILAGSGNDGDIIRTQNDGGAWATIGTIAGVASDGVNSLELLDNGNLLAGFREGVNFTARIAVSTDSGVNWSTLYSFNIDGGIVDILQLNSGTILATSATWGAVQTYPNYIYRSTDNGVTWSIVATAPVSEFGKILQIPADNPNVPGRILVVRGNNESVVADYSKIYISDDDGLTWNIAEIDNVHTFGGQHRAFLALAYHPTLERLFLLTYDPNTPTGNIYRSINGDSWIREYTHANLAWTEGASMVIANNDRVIVSPNTIWGREWSDGLSMGRSNTCNNEVFVANKSNIANITHIKSDDGGVFTDIFPMVAYPTDLWPAVPADNDALYIGIDSSIIDSGPFDSVVFDLASTFEYHTAAVVLEYEYWNGAWVALSVQDGTDQFQTTGVNSIHWEQPSDWTTTAVDGVTAYWIRVVIDATGGTVFTAPPSQQNRQVYSVVQSFAQIDDTSVLGDIPALMRAALLNRSDKDGGSNPPELADNRLIAGLRSYDRGELFKAYINFADEQNDDGITVAAGTNSAFAADVTTPTGRRITYSAVAGDTSFVDRATIQLGASIIQDYYGIYHAFFRGKQHSGSAGDIDVRLQIRTGSGGITKTTTSKQFQTTNDWQLLDFGQVRIPTSSILNSDEIGDENIIAVQMKNTSGGSRTIYLYDLILIPVDEWALDSVDKANTSDSIIGRLNDIPRLLDVDSLTSFKRDIRTLVKTTDINGFVIANYNAITNGSAILQANANQRLWFLSAKYGASDEWVSEPWVVHSVNFYKNERYLGLRGDR